MALNKRRKIIDRLDEMLEAANTGEFQEGNYDESKLSRLEVKWKRFLETSALSKKKLESEQNKIKELVSDISHQTKTPLSNILLYAQILEEKVNDEELKPIVRQIQEQSEKLSFLIQSLVKTSRLESEVLVLTPRRQKIYSVLAEVVYAAEQKAAEKQIVLNLKAGEDVKEVSAVFDRKWTAEALDNLVDNAIKYSKPKSTVTISMTEYEMFLAIQIMDDGIGIREEEQAQIFGRFYRGKEVSEEKGVGIGLYLVREIAARQGGYVKVNSVYGKGSIFSFYIPRI